LITIVSLIVSVSSLSILVRSVQSAAVTTVNVVPQSVTASVGEVFTVSIRVTGVLDLYGWQFKLNWTASTLDVVNVVEGSFLNSNRTTFFTFIADNTTGHILVDCTLVGPVLGVNGDGVLANMTFYVKEAGQSPLDLYEATLLNSREMEIPCELAGGYGYFNVGHDVAVTNIEASPTMGLIGDIIEINVTVQNLGGFDENFNVTVHANSQVIGIQSVSLSSDSTANLTFTWDTTGFGKGEYAIAASASVVQGEVETGNNTRTADVVVTLLNLGHDVAIVSVAPLKTVVGQGYSLKIAVTVKDYGVFDEAFNVTAYADSTAVDTQTVALASGQKAVVLIIENTSGIAKGNYTLSAEAGPVPEETETADNTAIDGWVVITIPGDVNGDESVNIYDAIILAGAYNSQPDVQYWNPNADINGDNVVDLYDAILLASSFGVTGIQ